MRAAVAFANHLNSFYDVHTFYFLCFPYSPFSVLFGGTLANWHLAGLPLICCDDADLVPQSADGSYSSI